MEIERVDLWLDVRIYWATAFLRDFFLGGKEMEIHLDICQFLSSSG